MSIASNITSLVTSLIAAINARSAVGASDYQMWLAQGNTGDINAYRASMVGADEDYAAYFSTNLGALPTAGVAGETQVGTTQLATSAEAIAGTVSTKAMSPARVVDSIVARKDMARFYTVPTFEPSTWESTPVAGGINISSSSADLKAGMHAFGRIFMAPLPAAPTKVLIAAPASGGAWFFLVNRLTWNNDGSITATPTAIAGPTIAGTTPPTVVPQTPSAALRVPGTTYDAPIAWVFIATGATTPTKVYDIRPHRSGEGSLLALSFNALVTLQGYMTYGAKVAVIQHTLPSGGLINRALFVLQDGIYWQAHGDISVNRSGGDPTQDIYLWSTANNSSLAGAILLRGYETRVVDSTDGYRATYANASGTWQQDNPKPITITIPNTAFGAGFAQIALNTIASRPESASDGYIAPRTGNYLVHTLIRWADNPANGRNIGIGVTVDGVRDENYVTWGSFFQSVPGASASRFDSENTRLIYCNKGQHIGLQVFVDGGTLSTTSGSMEITPVRDF